ncbi:MAG: peptidase dimerization domain-containing protein [Dokdonella sp.]
MLTIGALQAGSKENIIPDKATLKRNMRTYDEHVREHMLGAIQRICCAEADTSGAPQPPDFVEPNRYPLTENDAEAAARVAEAFRTEFGDAARDARRASASEDFSEFGHDWKVPCVSWFVGGTDPATCCKALAEGSVLQDSRQPFAALCVGAGTDLRERRASHAGRGFGMAVQAGAGNRPRFVMQAFENEPVLVRQLMRAQVARNRTPALRNDRRRGQPRPALP